MKPSLIFGIALCSLSWVNQGQAREVIIRPGESVLLGETEVVCRETTFVQPVGLTECQIWDDYEKHCLHERRIFSVDSLECIEECQHWDAYGKTCFFATSCTFYPSQQIFVRTTCGKFDQYSKKCQTLEEEKVSLAPSTPVKHR